MDFWTFIVVALPVLFVLHHIRTLLHEEDPAPPTPVQKDAARRTAALQGLGNAVKSDQKDLDALKKRIE